MQMLTSTTPTRLQQAVAACKTPNTAPSKPHVRSPGLPRAHLRLPRRKLVCRADVNFDAFSHSYIHRFDQQRPVHLDRPSVLQFDYIVLGSGIAGLSYALKVAEFGRVAVITKDHANEGCTQYAQGGVCAVLDAADSVESHVKDTIIAGACLNDRK